MSSSDDDDEDYVTDTNTFRKRFSQEEDEILKALVEKDENTNWVDISKHLPGRSPRQCRDRYRNYLFKDVIKKPWTLEEDNIILDKYQIFGPHWVKIAQFLDGRSGNNVKNRWHKHLAIHNARAKDDMKNLEEKKKNGEYNKDEDSNIAPSNITFPEVLTCRPWELITPGDLIADKKK